MKKIAAVLFTAGALLLAGPAMADPLGDAKQAGLLGERMDGYLGAVKPGAPGNVVSLMNEINAKRKAEYARIAAKNGQTVEVVEKLIAAKLYEKAASGEYVMNASGQWVKR